MVRTGTVKENACNPNGFILMMIMLIMMHHCPSNITSQMLEIGCSSTFNITNYNFRPDRVFLFKIDYLSLITMTLLMKVK